MHGHGVGNVYGLRLTNQRIAVSSQLVMGRLNLSEGHHGTTIKNAVDDGRLGVIHRIGHGDGSRVIGFGAGGALKL